MRLLGKQTLRALMAGVLSLMITTVIAESAVTPGSKAATMDACVADTPLMRRDHMEMLKHDRDLTVRKGLRNNRASLTECVACHAEKDDHGGYKPIDAEGQFCATCHTYVAVNVSCFQCHRKTPEEVSRMNAAQDNPHRSLTTQILEQMPAISQEQ